MLQATVSMSCKPLFWHVRAFHRVMAELLHAHKAAGQRSVEGAAQDSVHASESDLQPLPEAAIRLSCVWRSHLLDTGKQPLHAVALWLILCMLA